MAFALVANVVTAGGANLPVTSGSINTTGADLLVVIANSERTGNGTVSASDSKSNTWTALTQYDAGNNNTAIQIFYAWNPTSVGTAHTATLSGTTHDLPSIAFLAFSGAQTSANPFDVASGASSAGATSLATGSVTPSTANQLLVAGVGTYTTNPNNTTVDWADAILDKLAWAGAGTGLAMADSYQIQTTATARNPTFSWSPSVTCAAAIATFKAAAGATASRVFVRNLKSLGAGAA